MFDWIRWYFRTITIKGAGDQEISHELSAASQVFDPFLMAKEARYSKHAFEYVTFIACPGIPLYEGNYIVFIVICLNLF